MVKALADILNERSLLSPLQYNTFNFGFPMEFSSARAHVHFVQTRWMPEVSGFLELDYEPL